MSIREYIGYLIAALLLVWHMLGSELQMRLDWINFGSSYQQQQQRVVEAVQALDRDAQTVKARLSEIEKGLLPKTPPEKTPEKK